jgi:hypothetical protein
MCPRFFNYVLSPIASCGIGFFLTNMGMTLHAYSPPWNKLNMFKYPSRLGNSIDFPSSWLGLTLSLLIGLVRMRLYTIWLGFA